VGLSRTVLKECFKHEFNVSIQQFKTEQKIRKIKESMLDTDDDFTSIADALGMCDVKHFFRFFKQHFHDTAERWRKRNKK
jgi:AraC-like DNA-binding protein